jgi:hypothetical protein
MDGSALNGNPRQEGFDAWSTEAFPDIKAEELPDYIAVTTAEEPKPGLITHPPRDDYAELQRLSQEYTPDVTVRGSSVVCLCGAMLCRDDI